MISFRRKFGKTFWLSLIIVFVIGGCTNKKPSLQELSESYKQSHDYESLVSILPYLNFTMTRAEVEGILGKPDSCFGSSSCQYVTTQTVIAHCATPGLVSEQSCSNHYIVLAVGYHLADSYNSSPQDVLWTFSLSPVGE